MTLSEWADVARIVSSIGTIVILATSVYIAYRVHRWQRDSAKAQAQSQFSEQMRHFNFLILESEELQALEAKHHPWGKLSCQEVKNMYRYFVLLNVAHSLLAAKNSKNIDEEAFESHMTNFANMMFDEREFIKKHCLPRGYPKVFRQELINRWESRDKNGITT